jgi:hypothetical protein
MKKLELIAAKALHFTNTDITNEMITSHKLFVCLVCDCFIMGSYSRIKEWLCLISRNTVTGWEYNAMKNSMGDLFIN